ncbi:MAG TPA: nucleotidyltransferase family protein, partial [Candidatus Polarisedimenticolia bacterium]|nr:nucleotidyltransferase family protein [Candidatus Polarisedimenticolia bacterium]
DAWRAAGRLGTLPPGWRAAVERAHRMISIDNLGALADFKILGRHLAEEGVPFILLKGAAYLVDLYDDPGARMLTDIDLLVQKSDVSRLLRRLAAAGFETRDGLPEYRRFELAAAGRNGCHFEFHWWLGLPFRDRIGQEEVWRRSTSAVLEGVPCRRLAPEDAILYHAAHQADHYFGPTLKWAIDLREMLRHWKPDPDVLLRRAVDWRLRIALALSLRHVDKIFPGVVPPRLLAGAAVSGARGRLLRPFLSSDPVQLVAQSRSTLMRYALRCLLIDRPINAVGQILRVLARPIADRVGKGVGRGTSAGRSD